MGFINCPSVFLKTVIFSKQPLKIFTINFQAA